MIHKRYVDFPMPQNTMMINGKMAIVNWKDEPYGILIKSKNITKSYSDFFDAMWKIAKK